MPCGYVVHRFADQYELIRAEAAVDRWLLANPEYVETFISDVLKMKNDNIGIPQRLAHVTVWTAKISANFLPI